jgi:hypothetical protein
MELQEEQEQIEAQTGRFHELHDHYQSRTGSWVASCRRSWSGLAVADLVSDGNFEMIFILLEEIM